MARNEDGEFELMVGNRQLLTIVFIIFVLCGIVFTMGYFVGRNSGPPLSASTAGKMAEQGGPIQPTGRTAAAESEAAAGAPLDPGEVKVAAPPQSAAAEPAPESTRQAETAVAPAPKQTPPVRVHERPEPKRPEPSAASGTLREPVHGQTYIQVAAVARSMAETLADVLQKKSLPAFVAPGPNDTLFRVLVGPVKDAAAIARLKADLEGYGIRDTRVKKY